MVHLEDILAKGGVKNKRSLLKKGGYNPLELLFGGRSGLLAHISIIFLSTPIGCT